uniref:TIL domain-containing protein n=1 Tax=Plectus sambesii TaxID=2011161 RepID=A0A914VFZ2_9BILA
MSLMKVLVVATLALATVGAQNCPVLIFPNPVPDNCQVIVAQGGDGCRAILLVCDQNRGDECRRSNEIFYRCSNECEQSCRNPLPNCNTRCGPPKCQCRPNFLRDGSGNCVPPNQCGVRGFECLFDDHCGFGRRCVNRQCVFRDSPRPPPPDNSFCRSNSDCSRGWDCFDRRCIRWDVDRGCRSNGECFAGRTCVDRRCIRPGNRCDGDRDCFGRDECVRGLCEQRRDRFECNSDRDCRPGNECQRGRCSQRGPGRCNRDFDCDRNEACNNGRCEQRRDQGNCRSDRDCFRGNCVFGRCVNGGGRPDRPDGGRPDRPHGGRPDRPDGGRPDRPDGGRPDRPDGGRPDRPDGGRPDRPDGGRRDGGRPDGSRPDGGRPDRPEGGRPDGGRRDGGRPDGGRPDGGRPDGGRPDGGRPDRPDGERPDRGNRGGERRLAASEDDVNPDHVDIRGCDGGCDERNQECRNGRCVDFGDEDTHDRVTAVPSLPRNARPRQDSVVLIGGRTVTAIAVGTVTITDAIAITITAIVPAIVPVIVPAIVPATAVAAVEGKTVLVEMTNSKKSWDKSS